MGFSEGLLVEGCWIPTCGCHNKALPVGWLNKICVMTLESQVSRGPAPSKTCKRGSLLASSPCVVCWPWCSSAHPSLRSVSPLA